MRSTVMAARLAIVISVLNSGETRADTALDQSTPSRKVILVLGDSLAAGYGLDPNRAFPALLQEKINHAGLSWEVVNAGLSGDTSAGGLRRINWLLRRPIDLLVLELGGNDGLRGVDPDSTRQNLQEIIQRARAKNPGLRIVIAGMEMPPGMGADYTSRFKAIFPALAESNGAALIPFLLEKVGGVPELNQPDRIHPTAEGQRIIAENVWKVLRPIVEDKPDTLAPTPN